MKNSFVRYLLATIFAMVAFITPSFAAGEAFDSTTYSTTLTTGMIVVGSVAGGIAAISAGVMVWKKVRKYFGISG